METEEAVEIHRWPRRCRRRGAPPRCCRARRSSWDRRGDHHAETVHRATLEHGDENLGPSRRALGVGGAHEEARDGSQAEQGEGAGLHERAARGAAHAAISSGTRASPARGPRAFHVGVGAVVRGGAGDLRIVELGREHACASRPSPAPAAPSREHVQDALRTTPVRRSPPHGRDPRRTPGTRFAVRPRAKFMRLRSAPVLPRPRLRQDSRWAAAAGTAGSPSLPTCCAEAKPPPGCPPRRAGGR